MTTPYLNDREAVLGSLFDKPFPEGYSKKWIENLKTIPHEEKGFRLSVLVFRVRNEWLALPTSSVRIITAPSFIHKIPYKTSELLMGLKNVEGELRMVVSLLKMLGLQKEEEVISQGDERSYPRDLYFGRSNQDYVFSVDEVDDIASIRSDVLEKPSSVSKSFVNFTRAFFRYKNRTVGLLDEELLLDYLKQNFV